MALVQSTDDKEGCAHEQLTIEAAADKNCADANRLEVVMNKHHGVMLLAGITCVIALQIGAVGAEKMPLPSLFFQARTIAIVNDTDESYIPNRASDELKKWGRYQIVENADDADLVLVLALREDLVGLERNASTNSYTTVYGNAGSDQQPSTGRVTTQKSTTVAFFDGRTRRKVWSETRVGGSTFGSAAVAIIKDLSKRIEKEGKDTPKP